MIIILCLCSMLLIVCFMCVFRLCWLVLFGIGLMLSVFSVLWWISWVVLLIIVLVCLGLSIC